MNKYNAVIVEAGHNRLAASCYLAKANLCGAGAHPGGGVIGTCGRNAAREVIRDRLW